MSYNVPSADNQQETHYKMGLLRDYTPNTVKLPDLARLIAILYTDGCVSRHRLNSWRIILSNSSQIAIDLFIDSLVNVFDIPRNKIKTRMLMDKYYLATLTSKEVGKWLTDNFGTFRTLKFSNGKYPSTSINVKTFLKTAFSMDGGVKFYVAKGINNKKWLERNVSLACHHPVLRKQYKKSLESIGINSVNIEADNVIKIRRKENLEKFAKEVGFISGMTTTRHSKFWFGVEKNEVLNAMIDSYNYPDRYISLPRFNLQ